MTHAINSQRETNTKTEKMKEEVGRVVSRTPVRAKVSAGGGQAIQNSKNRRKKKGGVNNLKISKKTVLPALVSSPPRVSPAI